MTFTVLPDPKRSSGGYALLKGNIAGPEAWVVVFNVYGKSYLGRHGWQAAKVEFGPYPVETNGAEGRIVIGPEIVNHLVEYAELRFIIGDLREDVSWPDSINQREGADPIGSIRAVETERSVASGPKVSQDPPEDALNLVKDEDPVQDASRDGQDHGIERTANTGGGGLGQTGLAAAKPFRGWIIALLILLLLLAAGGAAAWYFWSQAPQPAVEESVVAPEPEPEPVVESEPVALQAEAAVDACAAETLRGLAGDGVEGLLGGLRECGSAVTPDLALSLIDGAARDGDAEALTVFAQLYDGSTLVPGIEDTIGLTFADNPALAAEYYHRATEAGSAAAQPGLEQVCETLSTRSDTLSQSAHEEYCS